MPSFSATLPVCLILGVTSLATSTELRWYGGIDQRWGAVLEVDGEFATNWHLSGQTFADPLLPGTGDTVVFAAPPHGVTIDLESDRVVDSIV